MMKRRIAALLAAILLLAALPLELAAAQTVWVYTKNGKTLNLRDEYTNKVIGHIPYGTQLETDPSKDAQTAAYVTYKGVSGYAKWEFLVDKKPPAKSVTVAKYATPAPTAFPGASVYQGTPYTNENGEITVTSVCAYIQAADSSGRGIGEKYGSVTLDGAQNLFITADVPSGNKISYWVINGVRYDFNETVKTILLKNIDQSFTFEVVYSKSGSSTLLSPATIQAQRTGFPLELQTINAQLCHITETGKGAGGWIKYFNFTNDYYNRATNEREDGGQVTARIKAQIPKGKKVKGWKFDQTELYFNRTVTHFVVRTLNDSMTYEPIFSAAKTKVGPTAAPRNPYDPPTITYPGRQPGTSVGTSTGTGTSSLGDGFISDRPIKFVTPKPDFTKEVTDKFKVP